MNLKEDIRRLVIWSPSIGALPYMAPLATLQAVVFGRNPSVRTFSLIPAVLFCEFFIYLLTDSAITLRQGTTLLMNLSRLRDHTLIPIPLESIVPDGARDELYRGVYSPELHIQSFFGVKASFTDPIWSHIRAYAVRPGRSPARLKQIGAIQDLNGRCAVFVSTLAPRMTNYQKFVLMHEIGHATKRNAFQMSRLAGRWVPFFFIAWALFFARHDSVRMMLLTTGLVAAEYLIRTKFPHSPNNLKNWAFDNERAADFYAVRHVPLEILVKIRSTLKANPIEDPRLTAEQDILRNKLLIENVDRRLAGDQPVPPPAQNLPSFWLFVSQIAVLCALGWLGQKNSYLAVWLVGGIDLILLVVNLFVGSINEAMWENIRAAEQSLIAAA